VLLFANLIRGSLTTKLVVSIVVNVPVTVKLPVTDKSTNEPFVAVTVPSTSNVVAVRTALTDELPTKKAVVLTTTLEPTNNDVADREVELIALLTVLLPTVINPVIVVLPSAAVLAITNAPLTVTFALAVILPTTSAVLLTKIDAVLIAVEKTLIAVIDVELIEVLTVVLPINKLESFRITLLPKATLAD